jgi:tungstate transport system substrate-binding protein
VGIILKRSVFFILSLWLATAVVAGCAPKTQVAQSPSKVIDVILATTTSTQDSGLLDVLIPPFEKKTGHKVKTIAVGSGQAIAMGEKGEADVLLTHAPDAEKKVLAGGAVINRRLVMHNDFILIGPSGDPAQVKGKNAKDTLVAIAEKQSVFVSRGDNSGTHQLEKKLWQQSGIKPSGTWYQESGSGMGQTLNIANEKKGYTITDRATYLAQKKNIALEILVEGDAKLLNIYHVMEVNPDKYTKVNKEGAKAFSGFLLSAEGQALIAGFGKEKFGQPLFFADGGKTEKDFGL